MFFSFSLFSSVSVSLCPSPLPVYSFHRRSLASIFTAAKGLSKQNSRTNRPWDEIHGGSWQLQAEAEVPVSICTELSKSDIVIQIVIELKLKCSRPCFSGNESRETTRYSHLKLWDYYWETQSWHHVRVVRQFLPCYCMGLFLCLSINTDSSFLNLITLLFCNRNNGCTCFCLTDAMHCL